MLCGRWWIILWLKISRWWLLMNQLRLEEVISYGSKEAIVENLKDAGCDQKAIDCCVACLDAGKKGELLNRLEKHRSGLLDKVHKGQKQIDCLDYLVYQINKCSWEGK